MKVETIVVVSLLYTNSAGEQSNLRGLRTGSISLAGQRGDFLWMDLGREGEIYGTLLAARKVCNLCERRNCRILA